MRGVTLVEILMVVIVLATVAGLAMPWFLGVMQSYRVRVAAWELAGDLRLARQRAVSLQQSHRICFTACASPVPGNYFLERQDPVLGWVLDVPRNDVPNGVGLTSNQPQVSYGTRGETGNGATITVTNNVTTYVVVAAQTGRVRVCKGTVCPSP
ncbi:MAG: Tfp pilus assembly protein FimT/FimU [Candidatus Methylomirabilales bacterium]